MYIIRIREEEQKTSTKPVQKVECNDTIYTTQTHIPKPTIKLFEKKKK